MTSLCHLRDCNAIGSEIPSRGTDEAPTSQDDDFVRQFNPPSVQCPLLLRKHLQQLFGTISFHLSEKFYALFTLSRKPFCK